MLFAPTPTDEALALPVLVVADVPVDSHRRRTVPGPRRSLALGIAADAIAGLAEALPGPSVLQLLPASLPASEVDAELRELIVARLRPRFEGQRVLDVGHASTAVFELLTDPEDPVADVLSPLWPANSGALRQLGVERPRHGCRRLTAGRCRCRAGGQLVAASLDGAR